jgi:saccharopine dehydrogenase-like NADP-dependent oxidoreductase
MLSREMKMKALSKVLIIGGYGNFGSLIAEQLAQDAHIEVLIAGRDFKKAEVYAKTLKSVQPVLPVMLDVSKDFAASLSLLKPDIVIHTSGPFQGQGYDVARACIAAAVHYIDLADGREFVAHIDSLNEDAKAQNVLICSGASSVPCLSGALMDYYAPSFANIETVEYAISTAQKTGRGLATVRGVLSYAGKAFSRLKNGEMEDVYGWLGLERRLFWGLGQRLLGYCDIPDLALFPKRYPDVKTITFKAGLELKILQIGLWMMAGLHRYKLFPQPALFSKMLLKMAALFDFLGQDNSGFYMTLTGQGKDGMSKSVTFELLAKGGDGLYIPCMPSILLAKKLARGEVHERGAMPCLGLITRDEYLDALKPFAIEWREV